MSAFYMGKVTQEVNILAYTPHKGGIGSQCDPTEAMWLAKYEGKREKSHVHVHCNCACSYRVPVLKKSLVQWIMILLVPVL